VLKIHAFSELLLYAAAPVLAVIAWGVAPVAAPLMPIPKRAKKEDL